MNGPHAGMGGMTGADNPHAAMDPAAVPVDPNQVLEGTLEPSALLKDQIKPGDIVFLSAKTIDPATGEPGRFPIAVERLDVTSSPIPFKLSGQNAMMPGTKFEGAVLITARVDRDGEARSRNPGDIEGTLKATIPQRGLKLALDTKVP